MAHLHHQKLWPDEVVTNLEEVSKIFDDYHDTYTDGAMSDGWQSSFTLLDAELQNILSLKSKDGTNSNYSKILDAGCADGLLADNIDFTKYQVDLYGIDISSKMLSITKNKKKYKDAMIANFGEYLPFGEEYFDVVIANGVLGYCASNKPIYEFLRVLKPNGYILITIRTQHFNDRGYGNAIVDLSERCRIVKRQVFVAFPNNPLFHHEFNLIVIKKIR